MTDKKFEKINNKAVMSIQQCTPVPNLSYLGKLQVLEPNLPKFMNDKNFEKINIKIEIII